MQNIVYKLRSIQAIAYNNHQDIISMRAKKRVQGNIIKSTKFIFSKDPPVLIDLFHDSILIVYLKILSPSQVYQILTLSIRV